jgi:predicted TIM-barrel fold metal-dependent hydrolase
MKLKQAELAVEEKARCARRCGFKGWQASGLLADRGE